MRTEPDNMPQSELHPELAAISAEAAALESNVAQPKGSPLEPVQPPIDEAQEWRDAAQFAREVLCALRDQYKTRLPAEQFDKLGDALHKGALRWGWTVTGLFGHPAFAIALAAFPIAKVMAEVEREIAAEKAAKAPHENTAQPAQVVGTAGNMQAAA